MNVQLIGAGKLINDLTAMHKKLEPVTKAGMKILGIGTKNEWMKLIRSAEFKAIKTSKYIQSIQYEPIDSGMGFEVGSDIEYSVFIEYGTRRMSPRPHMRMAEKKLEKEVDKMLDGMWDKL